MERENKTMGKFVKVRSFGKTVLLNLETVTEIYPDEKKVCRTDGGILYLEDDSMDKLLSILNSR